jgi:serine/threonine protein kinase
MPITASFSEGGLGQALIGEKITVNQSCTVLVKELLGEGKYILFFCSIGHSIPILKLINDLEKNSRLTCFITIKGGFAYVYLVRDISDATNNTDDPPKRISSLRTGSYNSKINTTTNASSDGDNTNNNVILKQQQQQNNATTNTLPREMVLKVTSISSRQQRDIAEKEAKLLSRLSHPSIVKMFDTGYRTIPIPSSHHSHTGGGVMTSAFRSSKVNNNNDSATNGDHNTTTKQKERTQHMILMEYCEGGHALNVCTQLKQRNERFDLSTLIIAFGQICNAVSYLHAQRPPIIHRDLKPENFLIKGGAYKLCDFGSAIFGHVELKTSKDRHDEEEVIEKTTTQMFRAPEMVDLFMSKKLTQATDVWALGCCLYALAFLKNCFEEGSNLAIISRNYKIPEDNPYGDGLVELLDRMLTQDAKCRADMTDVILCLSAVYSGKPLPPRKERKTKEKKEKESSSTSTKKSSAIGTFRTDGQGIHDDDLTIIGDPTKRKVKEAKKLDPNSAAARRRQAAVAATTTAGGGDLVGDFTTFNSKFDDVKNNDTGFNQDLAFSTTQNPFATFDNSVNTQTKNGDGTSIFGSFADLADTAIPPNDELLQAFSATSADWDNPNTTNVERGRSAGRNDSSSSRTGNRQQPMKTRSRSHDHRRKNQPNNNKNETPEEAIERLSSLNIGGDSNNNHHDYDDDDDDVSVAESVMTKGGTVTKKLVARRGVRRMISSNQPRPSRSVSRGAGLRRTKSTSSNQDTQVAANANIAATSLYHRSSKDNYDDDDSDS